MTKIHLLTTDAPIRERSDVAANCGETVQRARIAFLWDNALTGALMEYPSFNTCKKCLAASQALENEGRAFVYGVIGDK